MRNFNKEKILQAIDIVDLVGESVPLTRRGKDFLGLCPFHPDHKPSLHVSPTKQIFKCFACGAGGDAIKFLQLREKLEFADALQRLAQRAGVDVATTAADRQVEQLRDQMRQALVWARTHFQRNLRDERRGDAARAYIAGRGVSLEVSDRFGLGLAPASWDDLLGAARRAGLSDEVLRLTGLTATNETGKTYDRFRNRLMFPICDSLARPVAFGGRTLEQDPAKYLNSPESGLFSKSRVLYGLDVARRAMEERHEAVVTEGYLDVVLLHQFGFTHAVATLGTALTDAHVKLLRPLVQRIVLCFDGDEAGVKAADRALEVSLRSGLEIAVVVLPGGQDPADCVTRDGSAAFAAALASAEDALQFKWRQTVKTFGAGGAGAQRAAVENFIELVAGLAQAGSMDPLQQGLLLRRLGDLLSLPTESVHAMLNAALRRRHLPASSATPAVDEETASAYAMAIRGLAPGLVVAVEETLGLLISDAGCAALVDDKYVAALEHCPQWQRLYGVVRDVQEEQGAYGRADILGRVNEPALCELAGRACGRVHGIELAKETFLSARTRIAEELDELQQRELRQNLRAQPAAAAELFDLLRQKGRQRNAAFSVDSRGVTRVTS